MLRRALCFLLVAALAAAVLPGAQPPETSVATLIAMVRKAMTQHDSDNRLARQIRKVRLGESLDDQVIEELESEGAGPKSVEELLDLRDATSELPAPTVLPDFPAPPVPSREEQLTILRSAAAKALNYSSGLPDFLCTEIVHRYEDPGGSGKWRSKDILQLKLTYFGHQEQYQLVSINGRAAMRNGGFEALGGAFSEGEFGSELASIFLTKSKTEFRWAHWTRLRRRVAHVFYFRIAPENSEFRMEYGLRGRPLVSTVPGQHGYIYIDRDTAEVLRINRTADLPANFPVRKASTLLDYDFTTVAAQRFLLPLRAEIRMATDLILTRNHLEFTAYRKFSGESTITFDPAPQ